MRRRMLTSEPIPRASTAASALHVGRRVQDPGMGPGFSVARRVLPRRRGFKVGARCPESFPVRRTCHCWRVCTYCLDVRLSERSERAYIPPRQSLGLFARTSRSPTSPLLAHADHHGLPRGNTGAPQHPTIHQRPHALVDPAPNALYRLLGQTQPKGPRDSLRHQTSTPAKNEKWHVSATSNGYHGRVPSQQLPPSRPASRV